MSKNLMTDEELESVVGGTCYIYRKDLGDGKSNILWSDVPLSNDQQKKLWNVASTGLNDLTFEAFKLTGQKNINIGTCRGLINEYYANFCSSKGSQFGGFVESQATF